MLQLFLSAWQAIDGLSEQLFILHDIKLRQLMDKGGLGLGGG
jgi:hypothetical protein